MHKVLVTGITGFLGSHIAEELVEKNIKVIGLKRATSDIWRCSDFEGKVEWVNIDESIDWKSTIIEMSPSEIIHCAWIGVGAMERDDWSLQMQNVFFLSSLIEIMQKIPVSKFVFVGSQAEYGYVNRKVCEDEVPNAQNAYAGTKLTCLTLLETFCEMKQINWVWLRLFSVFGERESHNWLIPAVIDKMLNGNEMDFTPGDQKYAYLYVKDFAEIIVKIISNKIHSGVYNLSSQEVRSLRSIVENIRDLVNPEFKLNFGALQYRNLQSMHLEGDISKLIKQIGKLEFTDFNKALQDTVSYFIQKK